MTFPSFVTDMRLIEGAKNAHQGVLTDVEEDDE